MKRLVVLLVLLACVAMGYAAEDTTCCDTVIKSVELVDDVIVRPPREFRSVEELHRWFDKELQRIARSKYSSGRGYRLVPLSLERCNRTSAKRDGDTTTDFDQGILAPTEIGLFGNASLKTIGGKLLFPLRLGERFTLAPFGSYGSEVGGNEPYSAVYGVGAELRMFGKKKTQSFNPYVGVQQYWLEGSPGAGSGATVYFGTRLYLSEKVALDGNFGAAIWKEDTPEDRDLKDWIGRIGFTYALWGEPQPAEMTYCGAIITRLNDWNSSSPASTWEPISSEDSGKYEGEVRVYGLEEKPPDTICPPPDPCPPGGVTVGDITDLKFYNLDIDLGLVLDPFNCKNGLLDSAETKDRQVLIAILFDRKQAFVKNLSEDNTFFHLMNLQNAQYLGYKWDKDRSRERDATYDEFVKPMAWLDDSTLLEMLEGKKVERKILETLKGRCAQPKSSCKNSGGTEYQWRDPSEYRIGYVIYPHTTLEKLKDYLDSAYVGAAVKVRIDRTPDSTEFYKNLADPSTPDSLVDYFFSNTVKIEGLFADDVVLDGFPLCQSEILPCHKSIIKREVLPRLCSDSTLVMHVIGYVDATTMNDFCRTKYENRGQNERERQMALSLDRAKAVYEYLRDSTDYSDRLSGPTGKGYWLPKRTYTPEHRCVVIRFSHKH